MEKKSPKRPKVSSKYCDYFSKVSVFKYLNICLCLSEYLSLNICLSLFTTALEVFWSIFDSFRPAFIIYSLDGRACFFSGRSLVMISFKFPASGSLPVIFISLALPSLNKVVSALVNTFYIAFCLAPKIAPSHVRAFNTSSTSIQLTWRPIPPDQVGGIIRGYKIFWKEVNYLGDVILENETRLDNASYEFLDFTGLTKFQEYRFTILAFTKFNGVISPVISTMSDEDSKYQL